nr:hypothetical protein [Acidobacteriota bacterium]
MSMPEMALSKGTDPEHRGPAADAEYELLIEKLRRLESMYKLGDVDGVTVDEATGRNVWAFEAEVNELERLVGRHKPRLLEESPSSYFKFLGIQAEAKKYFDTATPAYRLDLYQHALELLKRLPERVPPDAGAEERRKLANIVCVIIAGLEHLQATSEFGPAIAHAQKLYDFVCNSGLAAEADRAFALKSVIYYFLGRAHRQRGVDDDYRLATDYFYKCSECYFELARSPENSNEDVIHARTRAMVSLAFGAGFLYFNAQSDLARAKGLIAQARLAFLKDNGQICCKLHYNYLELLY